MKTVESYEQLIQRFTKRTMQLQSRQDEIKGWYEEYVKNETDLIPFKRSDALAGI